MDSIMEVFDDVKETIGEKWYYIALAGVGILFLLSLAADKKNDSMKVVTGITSYPDAVTNANVIIDTLQDSIAGLGNDMHSEFENTNNLINSGFESTKDFIQEGFEKQEELFRNELDGMMGDIDDSSNSTGSVGSWGSGSISTEKYKEQMAANSAAWHSASAEEKKRLEAENQRLGAIVGGNYDSSEGMWYDDSGDELYDYTEVYKAEMEANSKAWHTASPEEKKQLEAANQALGKMVGGVYDSKTGTWSDKSGNKLF